MFGSLQKPWLGFDGEPLENTPGFRMNPDGTAADDASRELNTFGVFGTSEADLPGLHNFKPAEEEVPGFRVSSEDAPGFWGEYGRVNPVSFNLPLGSGTVPAVDDIQPAASADDPQGLKMARAAAGAAGLNADEKQIFHREISGQGITSYQELLRIARQIKDKSY